MFRKNIRHLQIPLTSHVDELPAPLRERLEAGGGVRKALDGGGLLFGLQAAVWGGGARQEVGADGAGDSAESVQLVNLINGRVKRDLRGS